jgi:hypothetical protein
MSLQHSSSALPPKPRRVAARAAHARLAIWPWRAFLLALLLATLPFLRPAAGMDSGPPRLLLIHATLCAGDDLLQQAALRLEPRDRHRERLWELGADLPPGGLLPALSLLVTDNGSHGVDVLVQLAAVDGSRITLPRVTIFPPGSLTVERTISLEAPGEPVYLPVAGTGSPEKAAAPTLRLALKRLAAP